MSNNNGPPTIYLNHRNIAGTDAVTLQGGPVTRRRHRRVRLTVRRACRVRLLPGRGRVRLRFPIGRHGSLWLSAATEPEAVDVWWPSGREQHFAGADRTVWSTGPFSAKTVRSRGRGRVLRNSRPDDDGWGEPMEARP